MKLVKFIAVFPGLLIWTVFVFLGVLARDAEVIGYFINKLDEAGGDSEKASLSIYNDLLGRDMYLWLLKNSMLVYLIIFLVIFTV